jgi:protein PhnA
MSNLLPPCPVCKSIYTYEDQSKLVCPECAHEWDLNQQAEQEDVLIIKDANGTQLQEGDKVTLIKDLKIKGTSSVIKVGTKAVIKRLVDGDHDIDCKVDGEGAMMLKSEFVKKVNA